MQLTNYHAKYFAHELTRRFPPDSAEKLAGAVASAQVDLNPHQVDAALFAFRSPLSRGALLADEVGLGKTIEAGLVLSQRWAERKRRVLVIVPSNLRKQWYQEPSEKFFLPCRILESKSYNAAIKQGQQLANRKLHRARPSGGLLQAIAVILAIALPFIFAGGPERGASLIA